VYVLNYQIAISEGATVASTVTYLLPVIAIVLSALVLSESVTVLAGREVIEQELIPFKGAPSGRVCDGATRHH
jgi:hypothetical protein